MGHNISALIIAAPYDRALAESYGLIERLAWQHVTVFPISHYWSGYWQVKRGNVDGQLHRPPGSHLLPTEGSCRAIAREITGLPAPRFAVIFTDYFGGNGEQVAVAYEGERLIGGDNPRVNTVLRELGVVRADGLDEWDTIGLADFRHDPDHLERFVELCDQIGA